MKRLHTLLLSVAIVVSVAGSVQAEDKLTVVTTLGILEEIAQSVGGDRVTTKSLVSPDQDPHFVRPRPTLMKMCREAGLFVEVGMRLELWVDNVVNSSGNPRIQRGQPGRVVASAGVRPIEVPARVSREFGDIHPSGNPHVWLDPLNVKILAKNIARGLERVDPAHGTEYRTRLGSFERSIDERLFGKSLLDEVGVRKLTREARRGSLFEYLEGKGLTHKLGGWLAVSSRLRSRSLVTHHKTWGYFGQRFGIDIPLEIEEKPGITPSAKHRDRVIDLVRDRRIKVLLVAIYYDPKAAEYIAEKTGAAVIRLPIDIGERVQINSYFALMDHILDQLLKSH